MNFRLFSNFAKLLMISAKVRFKERPGSDGRDALDEDMEAVIYELSFNQDNEARCEAMERLVQLVLEDDDIDSQKIGGVAQALSRALSTQFDDRFFPAVINDEYVLILRNHFIMSNFSFLQNLRRQYWETAICVI